MRYAEGPGVCCDVYIEADPSRVWGLVTDIGLPARLSPELQRVEWLDGAEGPCGGGVFRGVQPPSDGRRVVDRLARRPAGGAAGVRLGGR
ncbi:SRPBCC family protein [Streptomyces mirabilis]|uniref:SRPBCC family protein n=1 Tax=Streptomyces mirabilis TaxID=68239 RepID=UPI003319F74D